MALVPSWEADAGVELDCGQLEKGMVWGGCWGSVAVCIGGAGSLSGVLVFRFSGSMGESVSPFVLAGSLVHAVIVSAGGSGDAVIVSAGGSGEYVPSVVPDWVFWSSELAALT